MDNGPLQHNWETQVFRGSLKNSICTTYRGMEGLAAWPLAEERSHTWLAFAHMSYMVGWNQLFLYGALVLDSKLPQAVSLTCLGPGWTLAQPVSREPAAVAPPLQHLPHEGPMCSLTAALPEQPLVF